MMKTAEETVKSFLISVKKGEFKKAHTFCSKTYLVGHTYHQLRSLFVKKIISYKITASEEIAECMHDVSLVVKFEGDKKARKLIARTIKESSPWKTSIDGTWGVNPVSLLRGTNG